MAHDSHDIHRHEDHAHGHAHHGHSHHGHGHSHGHGPTGGSAFIIAAGLNMLFVVGEAVAGWLTHSLSLVADAGHNLSDVLSLVLAALAVRLASRPPSERRTYGLRKGTILASLTNATLLVLVVGAMGWEAIRRLGTPLDIQTGPAALVAGIGILLNGGTAFMFLKGQKSDLNQRGAFLHLISDAAISFGVVVSALVIGMTGWTWLDPVVTLAIAAIILAGTYGLMRESLDLALDAAPRGIDPAGVRQWLMSCPGVQNVHDLHIWAMSTTETALTVHLERPLNDDQDSFLGQTCQGLSQHFGIHHCTLQIESGRGDPCQLAPANVV